MNRKRRTEQNDRQSSEKEIAEIRVNKYERDRLDKVMERRDFWKLRRNHSTKIIFMCKNCNTYNLRLGNSSFSVDEGRTESTDRLWLKLSLCRGCVLWNLDTHDLHYKHAEDSYPDYTIHPKKSKE